jgi:hypothetical protein
MTEVNWRNTAHQLTMKLKYQHIRRQEKVDLVTRDWFKKVWRVDSFCGLLIESGFYIEAVETLDGGVI